MPTWQLVLLIKLGIVGRVMRAHVISIGSMIIKAATHYSLYLALMEVDTGAKESQIRYLAWWLGDMSFIITG